MACSTSELSFVLRDWSRRPVREETTDRRIEEWVREALTFLRVNQCLIRLASRLRLGHVAQEGDREA